MTEPPPPVLVGIDGTASGLEAVALGSAFAVLTGAPLVLGAVYGYEGECWPPERVVQQWLEEAGDQLGTLFPWRTTAIMSSSPAHGLSSLAARELPAMIVLGSSRRGPVGRVLLGSTARQFANGAQCALAVVPHGWRIRPPEASLRFGAGVTSSPESLEALAVAAHLTANAHASLRVLSAVHLPSPAHPMFAATGTSYEGWCRDQQREAERTAREAVAAVAAGVPTEIVVADGGPAEQLANASRQLDLLVVGSRRYGPVRRVLLGSVSSALIERVHCPMLIVPRASTARTATAVTHPQPPRTSGGELRMDAHRHGRTVRP